MVLVKSALLQVNATIIAGLLILLTIQTASGGGLSLFQEYLTIENQIESLEKLGNSTSDLDLAEKIKERIIDLKIEIEELAGKSNVNLTSRPFAVVTSILFLLSMIPFIGSSIIEMYYAEKLDIEESTKNGRRMTYVGFVVLFFAALTALIAQSIGL